MKTLLLSNINMKPLVPLREAGLEVVERRVQ